MMFSSDTLPAERVCPASASEDGYFDFHPPDAANGETIYDPFAYDVACLGGLLCESIGVCHLLLSLSYRAGTDMFSRSSI